MPPKKEIKEKMIEMIEGFNSDKELGIGGNLVDKFANELLELFPQEKQKMAEDHLRVLEESKQMSFAQGWKIGQKEILEEREEHLNAYCQFVADVLDGVKPENAYKTLNKTLNKNKKRNKRET